MNLIQQAKAATPHWMLTIKQYDGLEIMPCRSEIFNEAGETFTEPCEPEDAHFWTVYGHYISGGCEAFEDFDTAEQAFLFAQTLVKIHPNLEKEGIYHPYQEVP